MSRKLTISCPGCRDEFRDVSVDEAERILFHGCVDCREAKPTVEREPIPVEVTEDAEATTDDEPEDNGA